MTGRYALDFAENPCEMALVRKTAGQRDLGQRKIGSGKQPPRLFDPLGQKPLIGRDTKARPERPIKRIPRHRQSFRNAGDRGTVLANRQQQFLRLPDSAYGQTMVCIRHVAHCAMAMQKMRANRNRKLLNEQCVCRVRFSQGWQHRRCKMPKHLILLRLNAIKVFCRSFDQRLGISQKIWGKFDQKEVEGPVHIGRIGAVEITDIDITAIKEMCLGPARQSSGSLMPVSQRKPDQKAAILGCRVDMGLVTAMRRFATKHHMREAYHLVPRQGSSRASK
nr:hypothetical protein [Paracoccus aestuariivivens]